MTDHQLFLFLAEVTVLVVAARVGGELAVRLGIAQVVGELTLGIMLVPGSSRNTETFDCTSAGSCVRVTL